MITAMKLFYKDLETAQRVILIGMGVLLVGLLVIQVFFPGLYTTNIR